MDGIVDVIDERTFPRQPPINCPLCGAYNAPRKIAAHFGMIASVAYCDHCRLGYQTPRPTEDASAAYMNWRWSSEGDYVSDTPAKRQRAAKALEVARRAYPATRSILDFGAGAGIFVRECTRNGLDAIGVEQSEGAIERAKSYGVELLRQIPDRRFDMITMWDVVEHLREPNEVLSLLRSRLNPRGVLVMETGNYENWLRLAEGDNWSLYLLDHHFYFTPHSLESVARNAGYRSFKLTDAGKIMPAKSWVVKRPLHFLASWRHYIQARRKWPAHGDINVMIAVAGA